MRSDLLVNSRTGIVRRLTRRATPAHFPVGYSIVDSFLADTTVFGPHPADSAGAGYAFDDEPRALAAALGEAVERYCGNLVPPGLPFGPATTIPYAIDPGTLALFGPGQYATPGFPCVPLTPELSVPWAPAVDVATGRPAAVPASLVWVNHPGGPLTHPVVQAGLAAGPTAAYALWSGLCEVVERDAMTMTWTGRGPLLPVQPPASIRRLVRLPLDARWFAFPNEVRLPVIGALVRDDTTGYQALGMGAGADPVATARKALGEALQLLVLLADYDRPDSGFGLAATAAGSPLKPWRPHRDYANAYRPDLADVVDYGCHLQLHLDPTVQHRFLSELDTALAATDRNPAAESPPPATDRDPAWEPPRVADRDPAWEPRRDTDRYPAWEPSCVADRNPAWEPRRDTDRYPAWEPSCVADRDPAWEPPRDTADLVDRLTASGHRVLAADVTTDDVRSAGLHVTRVVVPGYYTNSAAGLPLLGGTRLPARLAGRPPRLLPLPH